MIGIILVTHGRIGDALLEVVQSTLKTSLPLPSDAICFDNAKPLEYYEQLLTERITVREVIRSRVHQEVKDHNASTRSTFRGLVRPEGATHEGGGFRFSAPRTKCWPRPGMPNISSTTTDPVRMAAIAGPM